MHPSFQTTGQNLQGTMSDGEAFVREADLAVEAERLGFSAIWAAEHHFDAPYSMCPDNLQLLTYIAARTSTIELVPAAVILPWWEQPMRVAEKVIMLDHLSGGRVRLGFGRGLARAEYERFQIPMDESRERFDEAAEMILEALDTGVFQGGSKYFAQGVPATLAPAPAKGFRDRLLVIAMSPDSKKNAALMGAQMASFVLGDIRNDVADLDLYKETFRATHGREPEPPALVEFMYCHEDSAEAERVAREYSMRHFAELMRHYEFGGTHFERTTSYGHYGDIAAALREYGQDAAAEAFFQGQTWGTPDEIVEKIVERRGIIGEYHLNCCFNMGGLDFERVERSARLFGEKVIPRLKELPRLDRADQSATGSALAATS